MRIGHETKRIGSDRNYRVKVVGVPFILEFVPLPTMNQTYPNMRTCASLISFHFFSFRYVLILTK